MSYSYCTRMVHDIPEKKLVPNKNVLNLSKIKDGKGEKGEVVGHWHCDIELMIENFWIK